MAAGLNRVELIGYVGRDPEMRHLPNGNAVVNLSMATVESWKDKSGEKQEKTEWHQVAIYGKLAEIVGQYVKKGSQVFVEGRIETKTWKDKSGAERKSTGVIADKLLMLGKKEGGGKEYDNGFSSKDDRSDDYDPWA